MDDTLKGIEQVVLAAAPAYEMYLLQVMGKAFRLKPPLLRLNSEKLKVVYDSVDSAERLIMFVEVNRAMGSSTITTEYWNDLKSMEPTARGEARVDASSENLMAPAFAFGWLNRIVGALEGVEDLALARMEQAEQLILKADEVLGGLGYVIEADSYESYANTLDSFLLSTRHLGEQTEGVLSRVGSVVRKAASAFGAAKGGLRGLKKRWADFKGSVKGAYSASHDASFKKWSGSSGEPKAKGKGGPELKLVKGGKKGKASRGKMSDKEYRARYGKARSLSASAEEPDEEVLVDSTDAAFSSFQRLAGLVLPSRNWTVFKGT